MSLLSLHDRLIYQAWLMLMYMAPFDIFSSHSYLCSCYLCFFAYIVAYDLGSMSIIIGLYQCNWLLAASLARLLVFLFKLGSHHPFL